MAKRPDLLRLYALLILIASIVYFYLTLLSPSSIPYFLKLGPLPRNINVLLLGIDVNYDRINHTGNPNTGRSDSIVLLNINPDSFKVNILSIPRDTLVEIPGYGWQKINASYFIGGPELAMDTVAKFLGVPVNNYLIINTRALIKLIDLMGGVRIYVDKDMYYVDNWGGLKINLKKGWQTLSGEQAHGYIRYRQDPLGDLSRVQRQQGFMQIVLKQLATPKMLAKAPWVIAIAAENIRTDMHLKDMLYTLTFVRGLRKNDINMSVVPGSFAVGDLHASIWLPDPEALHEIVNKYFSKKLLASIETRKTPSSTITVIDNADDFDAIRQMMKILNKKDYAIATVTGEKKPGITKTKIIAQKGDSAGAHKLGGILGIDEVEVSGTGNLMTDFTIVVCSDWRAKLESRLSK